MWAGWVQPYSGGIFPLVPLDPDHTQELVLLQASQLGRRGRGHGRSRRPSAPTATAPLPASAPSSAHRQLLASLPSPPLPQSNINLGSGSDGVPPVETASISSYGNVAGHALCRRDSPREKAAPYIALGGVQQFDYEGLVFNGKAGGFRWLGCCHGCRPRCERTRPKPHHQALCVRLSPSPSASPGLNTFAVLSASGPLVQIMQNAQTATASTRTQQSNMYRLLAKTFIGGTVACIPDDPTKHTRGAWPC